jgi:hypothetical protein
LRLITLSQSRPYRNALPELLEDALAQALPGHEAAAQNEVLCAFQPCPLSGKPDIEPTPLDDRV